MKQRQLWTEEEEREFVKRHNRGQSLCEIRDAMRPGQRTASLHDKLNGLLARDHTLPRNEGICIPPSQRRTDWQESAQAYMRGRARVKQTPKRKFTIYDEEDECDDDINPPSSSSSREYAGQDRYI